MSTRAIQSDSPPLGAKFCMKTNNLVLFVRGTASNLVRVLKDLLHPLSDRMMVAG